MKRKMKKKLIAFMLCMVLVICNSVSILADTPAAATTTAENQVSETKTAKNEKSSEETKSTDDNDTSKQSEETDETKDEAPEATTTEKKEETTEATTEEKEDATTATTEAEETTTEATTEDKATTEAADETSESDEKKEATTEETTEAADETTTTAEDDETTAANVKTYEYKSDDVNVTVTLNDPADLPDEAELTVKPVELSEEVKDKIVQDALGEENQELKDAIEAYDITFMLDGEEVQPKSKVEVKISKLDVEEDDEAFVYHVDDSDKIEDMEGKVNKKGEVVFDTTHFSEYAVLAAAYVRGLKSQEWYSIDQYNTMLQAMENEVEASTATNIPITSWTRTANDQSVRVKKVNQGDINDWTWTDVLEMDLSITEENRVWDGSRLDNGGNVNHYYSAQKYLETNVITATDDKLYDSATWTFNDDSGGDDASLHRFRGEFSIGDINPSGYAFTVKQVTGGDRIYVNDDIYIFIYPKTVTLTEENYTDYLAFWTGTIVGDENGANGEGENNVKFHGVSPANINQNQESTPTGFNKLTNGWYLTAESDNIGGLIEKGYNENDETEFYIDVIADDYSAGGGMYRLLLEKEAIKKYPVEFQKIDSKNSLGIPDAEFSFSSSPGKAPYTAKSDEDGYVKIDLPAGTYTMRETSVPAGYETPDGYWTVMVYEGGYYSITWHGNTSEDKNNVSGDQTGGYKITNTPTKRTTADFEFVKVKSDGNPLAGAEFKLKKINDSANPYEKTVTSGNDGTVKFEELSEGTYSLEETKAPEGYVVSSIKWIVEVAEDPTGDMKATLYRPGDNGEEPVKVEPDEESGEYEIRNDTQAEWLESNLESDKKVKVKDWDERTYEITISASSKAKSGSIASEGGAADVVLVLDKSGSMAFGPTSNSNNDATYVPVHSNMDKTKVYYKYWSFAIFSGYTPIIFIDNGWKSYDNGTWSDVDTSEDIYTCNSRMTALKEATIGFVSSMAESSPDSNIGIVGFDSDAQTIINMGNVSTRKNQIIGSILNMTASGATDPGDGLNRANDWLKGTAYKDDERPNYVVLFTDGVPTGNSGTEWDSDAATKAFNRATELKQTDGANSTIYTVGFGLNDRARNWLAGTGDYGTVGGIATSPEHALTAENTDQLLEAFQKIQESITRSVDITPAEIIDYVDNRFDILLPNGDIAEDGNEIVCTNGDKTITGTVEKGTDSDGKVFQYISWDGQTIPGGSDEWKVTFTIRAKEAYIGGNNVTTNGSGSEIRTSYGNVSLDRPTVNVKSDLLVGNKEEIIFKGENVPTEDEILKVLFDEGNPHGIVDGKEVTYTIGNHEGTNGNYTLNSEDFTLTWYEDEACENEITVAEMGQIVPDGTTHFYLKVTFEAGLPSADGSSTQNTDGNIAGNDKGIVTATNVDDQNEQSKRQYGIYTIKLITGTINIEKKSGSTTGAGLEGAVFKIEKWNPTGGTDSNGAWETIEGVGDSGTDQVKTKNGGLASFTNLGKGRYRITEIQAPEGYSLLANPIIVEEFPYPSSDESSGVSVSEGNIYKTETINDEEVKYYHTITYTIVNNELFEMPEAGGRNIFMMTLAGTAMIALAAGSTIYYRRRRGAHNKTRR